ncbi:MAG: serine/threonine-protein kinase [Leptolyngbyaceae cyanobacterium MO_188.B28]|nr:serine/threonine-protein kinase [Leptolyngbyaceae cyanobacterium MO_188.B28]
MPSLSDAPTADLTNQTKRREWLRRRLSFSFPRQLVTSFWVIALAGSTALDLAWLSAWERQVQTFLFDLRGPVAAPDDIIILGIDQESLSLGREYSNTPEDYPDLEPIQTWPWKRQSYAIAIERLMEAGAKSVALDILFPSPSSYGEADDDSLAEALQRYGDRVVLAAEYGFSHTPRGEMNQLILPLPKFLSSAASCGLINVLVEPNGRIHQLGRQFIQTQLRQEKAVQGMAPQSDIGLTPQTDCQSLAAAATFAEATLQAAQINYPAPKDTNIFFHGPDQTFKHIPFWYVIDADPWKNVLQSGAVFKDKIVLIGSTAAINQDRHLAPFSQTLLHSAPLYGVEIQANAIATLRSGNALVEIAKHPWQRGLWVLGVGVGVFAFLRLPKKPLRGFVWVLTGAVLWLTIGGVLFVWPGWILPIPGPVFTITSVGFAHFIASIVAEQLKKQRLRNTLARYVTSPIVQEIISQQDDLQDLLEDRASKAEGKVLSDRYRILKLLGSGGFSETYLARDNQRPGHPICVVKELKIVSNDPKAHRLAQRLFAGEAETLERLGRHDQIPRLLAYFEANQSFYLVQEMIEGQLFRNELATKKLSQYEAAAILKDLLPVIQFVHSQGVIHRDIKPSNVIRRQADHRLVLIDFGAVKQISNRLTDTDARITSTIGIGTHGYMPSEQSAGIPNFSSDLYALGVMTIEGMTGVPPQSIKRSPNGELIWKHNVPNLNPELGAILRKMVRYDFSKRYRSAQEAIDTLEKLDFNTLPGAAAAHTKPDVPIQNLCLDQSNPKIDPDDSDAQAEITTQILPENWPEGWIDDDTPSPDQPQDSPNDDSQRTESHFSQASLSGQGDGGQEPESAKEKDSDI